MNGIAGYEEVLGGKEWIRGETSLEWDCGRLLSKMNITAFPWLLFSWVCS